MAKDISDAITDLNNIFLNVAGIKRVYDFAPDSLASGGLPCLVPIVDEAEATAQAFGYYRLDCTLKYLLAVAPYAKGLPSVEGDARPFVGRITRALFAHVQLNDSANIDHLGTTSDQPLVKMKYGQFPYNGELYIGYEITLNVTIKDVIPQAV
jgi:hypothetical protein